MEIRRVYELYFCRRHSKMKKYLTLLLSAFLVLTAMTVSLAEPLAEDVINRFTDT